ncbi:MAG: PilW family protein [Gammaproteobacteria bacterium]
MQYKIRNRAGFSLIELVVALAISSILAIGIVKMYSASKNSFLVQKDTSKLQESGRFVFDMLIRDLRRSGYFGYNSGIGAVSGTEVQVQNTNTCPNDATWGLMLDRRITGLNDPGVPYACIAADYVAGDVLTMRYVEGQNVAAFNDTRYYLRSSFKSARVFRGAQSNDPANIINDGTPESTGQLRAFAYYIGDSGRFCKFNDANGNRIPIPTLYRESLNRAGLPERQEVAAGIENIQFKYGVDTNNDHSVNQYFDSQLISNDLTVTPNWNQVVAVRFWILARANCPAVRNNNVQRVFKTYNMGDFPAYRPIDNFKRQLFTSTVALRN